VLYSLRQALLSTEPTSQTDPHTTCMLSSKIENAHWAGGSGGHNVLWH